MTLLVYRASFFVSVIVLLFNLSGCETIVTIDDNRNLPTISVYSIAEEGKPFNAYVVNSFFYPSLLDSVNLRTWDPTQSAYKSILDWPYEFVFSDTYTLYPEDADFLSWGIIKDATVYITVNGNKNYPLSFNREDYSYSCSYVPQVGDNLTIVIKEGRQTLESSTSIPRKPSIEITKVEKYALLAEGEKILGEGKGAINGVFTCDTLLRIHCYLPSVEYEDYYRMHCTVNVSLTDSYHLKYHDLLINNYFDDYFYSPSILFQDERLVKNWHKIPPLFCPVFNGKSIDGDAEIFYIDLIITPYTELRELVDQTSISVELQTISPVLFSFIKESMFYRVTERDKYTVPIVLPTNVNNGSGIFAGIASDMHRISIEDAVFSGSIMIQDLDYLKYYYGVDTYDWK